MIGGAVGAIVGSNYGSGNINALATTLGATGGYLIGGQIAIILSKEEKEELNALLNAVDQLLQTKENSSVKLINRFALNLTKL